MLNIILVADFPLQKTGVLSTATGLLSHFEEGSYRLHSPQKLSIGKVKSEPLPSSTKIGAPTIIFTHFEYSELADIYRQHPDAYFHVGDWPGNHWKSVIENGNKLKGALGYARHLFRTMHISKAIKLIFVSIEDTLAAHKAGFLNAVCLPIGTQHPTVGLATTINTSRLAFSGNFRFRPNREAALELIDWSNKNTDYQIDLIGYHANDFAAHIPPSVNLHDGVPSVIDFLASHRPIYVSLVRTGAGAKNKILEAMVAGCPILCTTASLDTSTRQMESITIINSTNNLRTHVDNIATNKHHWQNKSTTAAKQISDTRSWSNLSLEFKKLAMKNC